MQAIRKSLDPTPTVKTIGIVFHVSDNNIEYVTKQLVFFQKAMEFDKKTGMPGYPFQKFFAKSPSVQQLHMGNCPVPNTKEFPMEGVNIIPPIDQFDSEEEQLVAVVMGAFCEFAIAAAYPPRGVDQGLLSRSHRGAFG
jgi:hypothetical protein